MRCGCTPFYNPTPIETIENDLIAQNAGNMIYSFGITRTLMTSEDDKFTPTRNNIYNMHPQELNEKHDVFIIPMADAFREDYIPRLKKYTKLVNQLKIPCVLIGAGVKAPIGYDMSDGFPFDDDVKAFIKAILNKSAVVGVRGQSTADYLTKLGFKEGRDHVVIGCPSMYTFGRELKIRDTNITADSRVCVNSSVRSPQKLLDFIDKSIGEFPDHWFIPQLTNELKTVYAGIPYKALKKVRYHRDISDPLYAENRTRFFINVPSWLEFLRQADFSFGARLHGNIAATLAGTPSIMMVKDERMKELAQYHELCHVTVEDVYKSQNIFELIEKADFKSPERKQRENFDRYIDFLDKNGVDHIYKTDRNRKTAPFDEVIKKICFLPGVSPIGCVTLKEQSERHGIYSDYQARLVNEAKDNYIRLTGKFKKLGPMYKIAKKILG